MAKKYLYFHSLNFLMSASSFNPFPGKPSNYDKSPLIRISDRETDCQEGWAAICDRLKGALAAIPHTRKVLVVECYPGIYEAELRESLVAGLQPARLIDAKSTLLPEAVIRERAARLLGDHPVFGYMSDWHVWNYLDPDRFEAISKEIEAVSSGLVLVFGTGAALLAEDRDLLVYADMARWEIQQRMRRNEVSNLGLNNPEAAFSLQYKQAYFIDWRACDLLKRELMEEWDYVLDTNQAGKPKLVSGALVREGLRMAAQQPFRVVPFFDPGVWGGQWMKEVCDLDRSAVNFAWGFDCVPEENSLLLGIGKSVVEIPSINLVFYQPDELLGENVRDRFGEEFPIRFDFLDTMDGGNLSLQVHPLTAYIQEHFGMAYTQDESYYMLDVGEGAFVYLGLRDDVDPEQMMAELEAAQSGDAPFDADKHVQKWPMNKHDHVLIPAGTVHCSGKDSMVLEISATPYIFTFKLWDWDRLGLDGKPRPISLDHGRENIVWDRKADWVQRELLDRVEPVSSGDGWREERTGLHELEFIETRRHWFTKPVLHDTQGTVHVLNLVEGREALVESPTGAFAPFAVHYAETFIVPAAVGAYTIRPHGESAGSECATLKAYVRVS